jgi:multidrug efflux pump
MTAIDVATAVRSQNIPSAAGQVGSPPAGKRQAFQVPVDTLGRLSSPDQFGDIVVRVGNANEKMAVSPSAPPIATLGILPPPTSTSIVRLRDVADVTMGAQNYNQSCFFDGKPSVGLGVYQLPGTNALDVANRVRARMAELKKHFPDGIIYTIGYDTTPFISESISEVYHTLRDAVILVAIVVLLFLQDWRAMILPMIDVPVSLIGTFAVMAAMGFSLNNISLFGLVLAIGIVVDDAIVVLENIERQMAKGLEVRAATLKAMEEITGPILGITLALCAVFAPCALISGITGRFFRQFAVTIAASTVISAINAITMTPSRALLIFKTEEGALGHQHKREALPWWIFGALGFLTMEFGARWLALAGIQLPIEEGFLQSSILFAPGLILGLVIGWFIIAPVNFVLGKFFQAFNWLFDAVTGMYGWSVGKAMRLAVIVLLVYLGLIGLTVNLFQRAPTGFVPQQDMGRLIGSIQLPDSASLERTKEAMAIVEKITRKDPGVAHTIAICGLSFVQQANGPNFGSLFVILKPFSERQKPHLKDEAIMKRLRAEWQKNVKEAQVVIFGSSPIPGLSVAGGFKVQVEDKAGLGLPTLQDQTDKLIRKIQGDSYEVTDKTLTGLTKAGAPEAVVAKLGELTDQSFTLRKLKDNLTALLDPKEMDQFESVILSLSRKATLGLASVSTQFRSNTPQLFMDIDRTKVAALGLSLDDVRQTIEMYLGSLYVNSFNEFGRHWQVTVQADGQFRSRPENVSLFQVRNKSGQMVSLGTVVSLKEISGPIFVLRYNLSTAAPVTGSLLPGVSSGTVIAGVNQLANESLPQSMKIEWTELMFMQIREGNTTLIVFGLAVMCVFLALSALYESWTLPLAVILVVPLCMLGSITGVLITNTSVNIFVQIGLVVLVGLACKNAILIVEFAKQLHLEGRSVFEATLEASRLRLRPILMTSFAFILGVLPLVVASGAGAEMRRSLGTSVFSGMIGVTFFGILLTPIFFFVIQDLGESRLFASLRNQWVFSCILGFLLGVAGGWLLAQINVFPHPWAEICGAAVGILVVVSALGLIRLRGQR